MTNFDLNSHGSTALYQQVLENILGPTENLSLLDIGCGRAAITSTMPWKSATLADLVDESDRPQGFGDFHLVGALDEHPIFERQYCAVYGGDVIEHLTKADGYKLLARMESLLAPGGCAVVFTPNGPWLVEENATSPHQHRSGWTAKDFPMGWQTRTFRMWHPTLGIGSLFAWYRAK